MLCVLGPAIKPRRFANRAELVVIRPEGYELSPISWPMGLAPSVGHQPDPRVYVKMPRPFEGDNPRVGGSGGRRNVQAAFYELLCSFFPSGWRATLERKMVAFPLVLVASDFFVSAQFKGITPIVKKLVIGGATAIIKTWDNAWATSTRMHEADVLPCIF